jgi:hypothetical protein
METGVHGENQNPAPSLVDRMGLELEEENAIILHQMVDNFV